MAQTIKALKKKTTWKLKRSRGPKCFCFFKTRTRKNSGKLLVRAKIFFKSNYLAELLHLCLLFKFVSFRLQSHKTWHWLVTSWIPVSHKRLTATFRNHLPNQSWNATSSCQGITVWSVGLLTDALAISFRATATTYNWIGNTHVSFMTCGCQMISKAPFLWGTHQHWFLGGSTWYQVLF